MPRYINTICRRDGELAKDASAVIGIDVRPGLFFVFDRSFLMVTVPNRS
jgi:hypothetical protein